MNQVKQSIRVFSPDEIGQEIATILKDIGNMEARRLYIEALLDPIKDAMCIDCGNMNSARGCQCQNDE